MAKPEFRYRQVKDGIIVEYATVNFWGREKWKAYVTYTGLTKKAWVHSELQYAEMNLKDEVHENALKNSEL
jgi:hypothetical protein